MSSNNGHGYPVKLGDTTFRARPLDDRDVEAMDARIVETRQTPLDRLLASPNLATQPPDVQERLISRAMDMEPAFADFVSDREREQFGNTIKGSMYLVYLMVRGNHPDVTEESLLELAREMSDQQFTRFMMERDFWSVVADKFSSEPIGDYEKLLDSMNDEALDRWLKGNTEELQEQQA